MNTDRFASHFKLDAQLSEKDREFLEDQINEFNITQTGMRDFQWLGYVLRAEDGTIVAGISGWTWGGCCEIRTLWVQEALRGQDLGQRLLRMAEQEAAARGCAVVVLDTHSFQAPGFYQKQGYKVVGMAEDYPYGHQKYYLQKRTGDR